MPKSQCVTGAQLLAEFGTPYAGDAASVARAYPWLHAYDGNCAAAEAVWGKY